jgi:proline racemase/trans-L-3-hydroxyproline dehydratase
MAEKKAYFSDRMDHIRTALMHEPRGHRDMFGALLLDPVDREADLGVLFMDGSGYLSMCGHGTIGVATAAIEMGMIEPKEPVTDIVLDTPAGLVSVKAQVRENRVNDVTLQNVPSFLYQEDVRLEVPGLGEISLDIAFGGNFYALVSASEVGEEIHPENAMTFLNEGMKILNLLKLKMPVSHPTLSHLDSVELVEFYGPAQGGSADARNVVVFGYGQFDRSPCGTGTCAKMAALFAKGELGLNQDFVHESIIGTTFRGRLIGEERVGPFRAVVPQITGQAFITGIQQFVIDPADPLKHGFSVYS